MTDTIKLLVASLPLLLKGAEITVFLSLIALVFGVIIGLAIALARFLKLTALSAIGSIYISIFRGTPLLVQLYIIYYGLPEFHISLNPITAAALGLTLNISAYLAESFRAALQSVAAGQFEAAYSIGFTRRQVMLYVVLPQSLRTALPTMGNTIINLVKDTSLVSVITVTELLRSSTLIIARTFQPLPLYIEAAIIYWLINYIFSVAQSYLERYSSRFVEE